MSTKDPLHEVPISDRYTLIRQLGAGGMGAVYEAHDQERDELVALKLLVNLSPQNLFRFKKEFRALSDLNHTNLVALYELVSTGLQWFFTMELVDGEDFSHTFEKPAKASPRISSHKPPNRI